VSGRLEQLARQIRKLRTLGSAEPGRTLQRALHLASDLAEEYSDGGDFAALAAKGIVDAALADRLGAIAGTRIEDRQVTNEAISDLDVFLRSIEHGAPAPAVPLPPLGDSPKLPPGVQKTAINISGRVVTLVGKDGRAFVLLDDKPTGQPFDLVSVPSTAGDVAYLPDGTTTVTWEGQLALTLSADFKTVSIGLA
jgi:hypothetical protein